MSDPKIDAALWAEWPPTFVGPEARANLRTMMAVLKSPVYTDVFQAAVAEEVRGGKELSYVEVYLEAKRRIDAERSRSE